MRARKVVLCIAVLLALSLLSLAQNTAELRGKVIDQAGNPVVSAFVLTTEETNFAMRAATTNQAGEFVIASLPVGTYLVQVKAEGFADYEAHHVRISIGEAVKMDVKLGTGVQSIVPPVSGASMTDTVTTQLGVVMTDLFVNNLPLKSRDTFELLQLQPGVQSTVGADLFFGSDFPGVVSVNGARARSNNNNVNSGHAGDQFVNFPSLQPSPDTVLEFRVLSHNYPAEFGRNSGSILNVVTKTGANDYHGQAYEFLRNSVLNARGYFDLQKPAFVQNDFGGNIGGPINKNKSFFFGSYSGLRSHRGISSDPVLVPTEPERIGNFSAGESFAGTLQDATFADILNARPGCALAVAKAGGTPIAAGTAYSSIFPGNLIPSACMDSTSVALLGRYVPSANVGGDVFQSTPIAVANNDQFTGRLDHSFTSQQQLSGYYYFANGVNSLPFARFQGSGANLAGFGSQTGSRFQQANIAHTWAIDAKTNNQLRLTYYRDAQSRFQSPQTTNIVQDSCGSANQNTCFTDSSNPALGITPGLGASTEGLPYIALAGAFSIGNNPNGALDQIGNVYQVSDTFSRIAGKHSLSFGVDFRNQRLRQIFFYNINGDLELTGGGPNDVGYANLFPNYLLGLADSFSQGSANAEDVRANQFDLFVQDSWKLRSNLVLNAGLRWELNTPQKDSGLRIQGFRPGRATTAFKCRLGIDNPLTESFGDTDCSPTGVARSVFPLGLVFPGDAKVPAGLTNTYYKAFAPRIGLAWSPTASSGWIARLTGGPGQTSIRAAWGL